MKTGNEMPNRENLLNESSVDSQIWRVMAENKDKLSAIKDENKLYAIKVIKELLTDRDLIITQRGTTGIEITQLTDSKLGSFIFANLKAIVQKINEEPQKSFDLVVDDGLAQPATSEEEEAAKFWKPDL